MQDKIESLYQQYPKVLEVFDTEQAAELTKEECAALIKSKRLIFRYDRKIPDYFSVAGAP